MGTGVPTKKVGWIFHGDEEDFDCRWVLGEFLKGTRDIVTLRDNIAVAGKWTRIE